MIPDGTPVGPLAKLIPLVTLSAKESRTALLDNTEEAACTIDFVDDPVNTPVSYTHLTLPTSCCV